MFDIGFFELLLIGVVALLVIGPEQLPETLRTLALWWGRLKRGLASTRQELEQHLGADDIRRQLHNEDIMRQLRETRSEVENSLGSNPLPPGQTGADTATNTNTNTANNTANNTATRSTHSAPPAGAPDTAPDPAPSSRTAASQPESDASTSSSPRQRD